MKSNGKYVFSLIYYQPSVPCCRRAKFCLNMPGDLDQVIILTSSTQLMFLVYNMDEWRICRIAEFYGIFLRLRWRLQDFNHMAGWGLV